MIKKKITFFYTDDHELHLCKSLSFFAKENGFNYEFTSDLKKKSFIGFYCQDSKWIKEVNSDLSFITIGGSDQGKLVWPNLWSKEPWDRFDVGFLPGISWKKKWESSSWDPYSRPKLSMNVIGWPKTELIYNNRNKFEKIGKNIKKKINFSKNKTIIYAPCFEIEGKSIFLTNIVKELGCNLIIKHHGWAQKHQIKKYIDVRKNINVSNAFAKKTLKSKVYIVDPSENIMNYYDQADLLITDESSVVYESLLFNLPSLCVKDWKMATNNVNLPRPVSIDSSVSFTCSSKKLKYKIKDVFQNTKSYKKKILKKKFLHFSYLENSSQNFYELLNDTINLKSSRFEIKPKFTKNYLRFYTREILIRIRKLKSSIRKLLNFFNLI
tara:strand:+ start:770 stop:1912 length:1143 start_codon:yes stop_codon:yes gene_type:complete